MPGPGHSADGAPPFSTTFVNTSDDEVGGTWRIESVAEPDVVVAPAAACVNRLTRSSPAVLPGADSLSFDFS